MFQVTSPLNRTLVRSSVFEDRNKATPKDNLESTTTTVPLLDDVNLYGDRSRQVGVNMNFDDLNNAWTHDSDFSYGGITGAELDNILEQI